MRVVEKNQREKERIGIKMFSEIIKEEMKKERGNRSQSKREE